MSDLKPCPFCGDALVFLLANNRIAYVYCESCDTKGPSEDKRKQAVAAWNRREPDWQAKWEGLVETVSARTDQAKAAK